MDRSAARSALALAALNLRLRAARRRWAARSDSYTVTEVME